MARFFEDLAAVTAERPRGHMEVLELGRVEHHVPIANVARDKGTVRTDDKRVRSQITQRPDRPS